MLFLDQGHPMQGGNNEVSVKVVKFDFHCKGYLKMIKRSKQNRQENTIKNQQIKRDNRSHFEYPQKITITNACKTVHCYRFIQIFLYFKSCPRPLAIYFIFDGIPKQL